MNPAFYGEALRRLRRQRGITQAELGERIGASRSRVSKWERGAVVLRVATAEDAVGALGYTFRQFLLLAEELADEQGDPGGPEDGEES